MLHGGQKFSRLSSILPFLPVFGGGRSRFQPVFVGDIGRAVEIISRPDREIRELVSGMIIEAGGPDSESSFTLSAVLNLTRFSSLHISRDDGARPSVYPSPKDDRLPSIRSWHAAGCYHGKTAPQSPDHYSCTSMISAQ